MTSTALAPGYARITYTGVAFPHHMTIPIKYDGIPVAGAEPSLLQKNALAVQGVAAITSFLAPIRPYFPTSVSFGLVEFHTVNALTGADAFIYAANLGLTGSGVGLRTATEQTLFTFKTAVGGLYRLYLMETIEAPNSKTLPPYVGLEATLTNFVTGPFSPVYGRGNSYPFVPISKITKLNDKLRKQQGYA